MPPKVKAKGKAKAKGKGKAKAKAKGKAKARAAAAHQEATAKEVDASVEVVEDGVAAAEGPIAANGDEENLPLAVIPKGKAKPKAAPARKRMLEEMGETPIEDVMLDMKKKLMTSDASIAEAAALEEAQAKQVEEAMAEYEVAKAEVEKAIEKEQQAAETYKKCKDKRDEALKEVDAKRALQLEAQKKLAMVEVYAVNAARMKELEDRKKAATEAAEEAKAKLAEQRQKEKEALEATRRALEEARQTKGGMMKGRGRGRRGGAADAPTPKRAAVEEDTVPATVVDGEDIS